MKLRILTILTLSTLALVAGRAAQAGVLQLDGIADGDSTYTEVGSNSFIQVDLYDPPPRQTQQRFHDITNPSITYGNTAFDGFPNDANWRLGSLSYDESGVVGGTGVAPITGISLGIEKHPTENYINYGRWAGATVIDTFSGTVTLNGGVVTSVNLTATGSHNYSWTTFNFSQPGTFSITGNRFEGHFDGPGLFERSIYDFSGTLSTVAIPEPATLVLSAAGLLGMVSARRSRRGK